MAPMGRHSPPLDGTVTANGRTLAPFNIQPLRTLGPVPVLLRHDMPDDPGQAGTAPDKAGRRAAGWRHPWPLLFIAAPAAVAVWSGWVGLGGMCGFGPVRLLPGIADGFVINTAITLPVGVEAYGAYALYVWLGGRVSDKTRAFARNSAFGALGLGCLGQVAYHLLAASRWAVAPWGVVMAVACLPVVTLSFAAALVHMTLADARAGDAPDKPEDKPEDKQADSGADKQADKPEPRKAIPPRTALDKAADIIRRHPDWADKKEWTRLGRAAGVSAKTVQRARNGTAKT
jgi:hypothetical protein